MTFRAIARLWQTVKIIQGSNIVNWYERDRKYRIFRHVKFYLTCCGKQLDFTKISIGKCLIFHFNRWTEPIINLRSFDNGRFNIYKTISMFQILVTYWISLIICLIIYLHNIYAIEFSIKNGRKKKWFFLLNWTSFIDVLFPYVYIIEKLNV